MLLLTEKELKLHQDATQCCICRKTFTLKVTKDKTHRKVRDHCDFPYKYRAAVQSIWNLRFNVPNQIPAVFHSGSN